MVNNNGVEHHIDSHINTAAGSFSIAFPNSVDSISRQLSPGSVSNTSACTPGLTPKRRRSGGRSHRC